MQNIGIRAVNSRLSSRCRSEKPIIKQVDTEQDQGQSKISMWGISKFILLKIRKKCIIHPIAQGKGGTDLET